MKSSVLKIIVANTHKGGTKSGSMIDNETKSPEILDLNTTNSATIETVLMSHSISLQETINKKDKEIRALMRENVKLQSY